MKSPQQLKWSINFYRVLSAILLAVVWWVGMSNMTYADHIKQLEAEKQEAINKQLEAEDKIMTGTCLRRLPKYEEL